MFFCLAKKQNISLHSQIDLKQSKNILRGGAVVARWAHNPKVISSNLVPATKKNQHKRAGFLFLYAPSLLERGIKTKNQANL